MNIQIMKDMLIAANQAFAASEESKASFFQGLTNAVEYAVVNASASKKNKDAIYTAFLETLTSAYQKEGTRTSYATQFTALVMWMHGKKLDSVESAAEVLGKMAYDAGLRSNDKVKATVPSLAGILNKLKNAPQQVEDSTAQEQEGIEAEYIKPTIDDMEVARRAIKAMIAEGRLTDVATLLDEMDEALFTTDKSVANS